MISNCRRRRLGPAGILGFRATVTPLSGSVRLSRWSHRFSIAVESMIVERRHLLLSTASCEQRREHSNDALPPRMCQFFVCGGGMTILTFLGNLLAILPKEETGLSCSRCPSSEFLVSSVSTYETYVDGLMASTFFALNGLVGCGHMPGLVARRICPLALMKSDDQNPYQIWELQAHVSQQVVFGLRWRPCGKHGSHAHFTLGRRRSSFLISNHVRALFQWFQRRRGIFTVYKKA
jgi:hypothetical protein